MISGLILKYLNGECFVIRPGYETARPASSSFDYIWQYLAERLLTNGQQLPRRKWKMDNSFALLK